MPVFFVFGKQIVMKARVLFVITVFLLMAINTTAESLDALPGFWGIDWKTSQENTKKELLLKGCTVEFEEKGILGVKGTFAGKNTMMLAKFYNDLLFSAVVFFDKEPNKAFSNYDDIVSLVSEKYGTPTDVEKYFEDPYYWGDGFEEQALKLNKAIVFSDWLFKDGNKIRVALGNLLQPALIYINLEMEKKDTEAKREKMKGDL